VVAADRRERDGAGLPRRHRLGRDPQQTKGQYPAPEAALELLLETAAEDLETALKKEAEGMAELFGSPVNAALINVFFLDQRNKKDKGVDRADVKPREVQQVGIVGAGIMGGGIAARTSPRHSRGRDRRLARSFGPRRAEVVEEASFNRETKGPDAAKAIELAPLLERQPGRRGIRRLRPGDRGGRENARRERKVFSRLEPLLTATRSWPPTPRRSRSPPWPRG
jgi:hypothetical protein